MPTQISFIALAVPLAFAVDVFLVGAALLIRGSRGRRIDDHPLCARCGFDLTGKPLESSRCSECGGDLSKPKSVTIGHRQRRVGLIRAGISILLLESALAAIVIPMMIRQIDWQRLKPLWWLEHEAASSILRERVTALDEISARLSSSKLNETQRREVIARALKVQGDPTTPWDAAWGDLIEIARARNTLSDEDWQRYIKQATPTFTLIARSTVARGDRLPVQISYSGARVGSTMRLQLHYVGDDMHFDIDGLPLSNDNTRGSSGSVGLSSSGKHTFLSNDLELWPTQKQLKDGKHRVRVTGPLELREQYGDIITPYGTFTCDASADFDYVPTSKRAVTMKSDESLRAGVESALKPPALSLENGSHPRIQVMIEIAATPVSVGLGYDIFLVAGGKEWKGSSLACPAGRSNSTWISSIDARDISQLKLNQVDVVLRPSAKAATETLDTFEIWDNSITFKNVPIKPKDAQPSFHIP